MRSDVREGAFLLLVATTVFLLVEKPNDCSRVFCLTQSRGRLLFQSATTRLEKSSELPMTERGKGQGQLAARGSSRIRSRLTLVVEHALPLLRSHPLTIDEDRDPSLTPHSLGELLDELLEAGDAKRGAGDDEEVGRGGEVGDGDGADRAGGGGGFLVEDDGGADEGPRGDSALGEAGAASSCDMR